MADYTISDNDYESSSDNENEVVYGRAVLRAIFGEGNIPLLKKVLKVMTPDEVYRIVGDRCFYFINEKEEYEALECIYRKLTFYFEKFVTFI